MAKSMRNRTEFADSIISEYLLQSFTLFNRKEEVPQYVVDLTAGSGILYLTDQDLIQELYGPKNKLVDKVLRSK